MARPREFDQDVVLRQAMELFWKQGYQATSLDDLVMHLGIGRASLYGAFGSKRQLFLDALDLYIQDRVTLIGTALARPGPVKPTLERVIDGFVRRGLDPDLPGCLVVNSAAELASNDPEVASRIRETWTQLEVALASALTRARDQGELPADRDPQALASFLVVFIQGLLVVGKGDPNRVRLRAAGEQAVSLLF